MTLDGADVVVVSYGITSRVAAGDPTRARRGDEWASRLRVGMFRLITRLAVPRDAQLRELAGQSAEASSSPS